MIETSITIKYLHQPRLQLGIRKGGQETQSSKIHPEYWNLSTDNCPSRPKQRSVTPESDDQVNWVCLQVKGSPTSFFLLFEHH